MIRNDLEQLTDEEVDALVVPIRTFILDYLKQHVIDNVVAMDIANRFSNNALWKDSLENIVSSVIEDIFYQLDVTSCDIDKIKSILETKYNMQIIGDNPIEIIKTDESN